MQIPIVDLLGVTIDSSLNFSKHVAKITKKVGKQFDVLSRLKNMQLINFNENLPLQLERNVLLHLLFCYLSQL